MTIRFTRSAERRELICSAIDWLQEGRRIAMITLINIEGNAPYPVGTQMLVAEEGDFIGQITGGCAEQAIAEQAIAAIKADESVVQRYGVGSPFFDIQLPCGSGIDVFIDSSISSDELIRIKHQLRARQTVISAVGAYDADAESAESAEVIESAQYQKHYYPNQRLVLMGQGPILTSCAKLALGAGFDVLCVAQNQQTVELAKRHSLTAINLSECPDLVELGDQYTGLVSLFHEHEHEALLLSQALNSQAFYIGALGSKRTHAARLELLSEQGFSASELARIHGPVGVNIQAKTPSQIAIAIVAQAIDELNKMTHAPCSKFS